jgi:hypothetical protein
MLDGKYVSSAAKEKKIGGWREYSTDELPLDSLESAWN